MPEALYVDGARVIDNPDNSVRYDDPCVTGHFDPEGQNLWTWARKLKEEGAKADSASDIYDSVNVVLEERCGIVCVDRPDARVRLYPDLTSIEITYYPDGFARFNQTHVINADRRYRSDELYAWMSSLNKEYGNTINSSVWYETNDAVKRLLKKIEDEMPIEVWQITGYEIDLPIGSVMTDMKSTFVVQGGRILKAGVILGREEKPRSVACQLWDANDVRTHKRAVQIV